MTGPKDVTANVAAPLPSPVASAPPPPVSATDVVVTGAAKVLLETKEFRASPAPIADEDGETSDDDDDDDEDDEDDDGEANIETEQARGGSPSSALPASLSVPDVALIVYADDADADDGPDDEVGSDVARRRPKTKTKKAAASAKRSSSSASVKKSSESSVAAAADAAAAPGTATVVTATTTTVKDAAANLGRMLAARANFAPATTLRPIHATLGDEFLRQCSVADDMLASEYDLAFDGALASVQQQLLRVFRAQSRGPKGAARDASVLRLVADVTDRITGTTVASRDCAKCLGEMAAILVFFVTCAVGVVYVSGFLGQLIEKGDLVARVWQFISPSLYAGVQPGVADFFHEHSAATRFANRLGDGGDIGGGTFTTAGNDIAAATAAAAAAADADIVTGGLLRGAFGFVGGLTLLFQLMWEFLALGVMTAAPCWLLTEDEPITALLTAAAHLLVLMGMRLSWWFVAIAVVQFWARPRVAAWYTINTKLCGRRPRHFIDDAIAAAIRDLPVAAAATATAATAATATATAASVAASVGTDNKSADGPQSDTAARGFALARDWFAQEAMLACRSETTPAVGPTLGRVVVVRGFAASREFLQAWRTRAAHGDRLYCIYVARSPPVSSSSPSSPSSSPATEVTILVKPRSVASILRPELVAVTEAAAPEVASRLGLEKSRKTVAAVTATPSVAADETDEGKRICDLLIGENRRAKVAAPLLAPKPVVTVRSRLLVPGIVLRFNGDMVAFLKTASVALREPMQLLPVLPDSRVAMSTVDIGAHV
jgi:hypothetical protein